VIQGEYGIRYPCTSKKVVVYGEGMFAYIDGMVANAADNGYALYELMAVVAAALL